MNTTKNKVIGIFAIVVTVIIVILFVSFFRSENYEDVKYNLFYKPVYTLFSGGLYFPYYLRSIKLLLILLLLFIGFIYVYWGKWREFSKIKAILTYGILIIIILGCSYLFGRSILTDTSYVLNNTYCEEEVDLLSLEVRKSVKRRHFYYYIGRQRLDVYQYRELKAIKDNYKLTLENFDRAIKRKDKYAGLPPFSQADKINILSALNSSNQFIRNQTLNRFGIEIFIKVRIRYLPSSKQVLTYELID